MLAAIIRLATLEFNNFRESQLPVFCKIRIKPSDSLAHHAPSTNVSWGGGVNSGGSLGKSASLESQIPDCPMCMMMIAFEEDNKLTLEPVQTVLNLAMLCNLN